MHIAVMAWRNIWRKKRRSALSILAVGLSCALLIVAMALQQGSYADLINNTVRARTGHIQIQHRDYEEDRDLNSSISDPAEILRAVAQVPHVAGVAPRVNAAVLINCGERTFAAMLTGIDPEREPGVSRMSAVLRQGAWLSGAVPNGALLGTMLAKNIKCSVGDEVVFLGQCGDGSTAAAKLVVSGILEFGIDELDRGTVVVDLASMQDAFALGRAVSEIAVLLDDDRFREETVDTFQRRLAHEPELVVLGWPQLIPGMSDMIRIDWFSGLIIYGVLVLVVGFGIANTFLMAFMERIREYGILLALGMRPGALGCMAYAESLLLIAAGIVAGLVVGLPFTAWLSVHGMNFHETAELSARYGISEVLYPKLVPLVVILAVAIVSVVSAIMGLYPAVRAACLKPVEALRHT